MGNKGAKGDIGKKGGRVSVECVCVCVWVGGCGGVYCTHSHQLMIIVTVHICTGSEWHRWY